MPNRVIVGTAGHIDHGKSALVRALTGIDPDRLKEEKERGITIELGFAHLLLPSGTLAGIIDVPGHEKFVRTMVAGAAGIDIVMLIVAADTGGGLPALVDALDAIAARVKGKDPELFFRLPVDRSFSMKGFGTVVTGTITGGTVRTGDEVQVLPGGPVARVRGLQVHGGQAESSSAGTRTAGDLPGGEKESGPAGSGPCA